MDEAAIESKGIAPLKPQLDAIAAIADRHALARVLGGQLRADVDPLNNTNFETGNLFGVWIAQGLDGPIAQFPVSAAGRSRNAGSRLLSLHQRPHGRAAQAVSGAHRGDVQAGGLRGPIGPRRTRVRARNENGARRMPRAWSRRTYMLRSRGSASELAAKAPGLDWPALLDAAGLQDAPVFMSGTPKRSPGSPLWPPTEPLDAWKDWLAFHAIEKRPAPSFRRPSSTSASAFYGKALSGIPELRPRWQRGMDYTSAALGEAVGKVYVERYFPAATKAKAQAMVADLVQAFAKRIDALAWMSPETKAKAKQKLDTLKVGVGYPDQWQDYSRLEVVKGDALGNAQRAELFEYHRQLAKLHQPVDRGEWWMTPQTVNAVNLPLTERAELPGRDHPAAVFRSGRRRRAQLRLHGRDHRP